MLYCYTISSYSLKDPLALLLFILGRANNVLSIPLMIIEHETNEFTSGCHTFPNK